MPFALMTDPCELPDPSSRSWAARWWPWFVGGVVQLLAFADLMLMMALLPYLDRVPHLWAGEDSALAACMAGIMMVTIVGAIVRVASNYYETAAARTVLVALLALELLVVGWHARWALVVL